jgi:general secretion pathway protein D
VTDAEEATDAMPASNHGRRGAGPRRLVRRAGVLAALLAATFGAALAHAQPAPPAGADQTTLTPEGLVNLDFQDVEIATVIDTIARLSGRNFVYDDRVRGRVTIISPTPIPVEQAYTVFESVLQVKGFTTVEAPGGVIKVIPVRDAKETSVDTREGSGLTPDSDRFVTRLLPLRFIDAEAISNTLKPLASKEAALVAYGPTNTIILTDSAANILRIQSILESLDVETHKEELAVIRPTFADAQALAEQLSEVFGAEVSTSTPTATRVSPRVRRAVAQQQQSDPGGPSRGQVRIITDVRTNALIILASRTILDEMRVLVRKLDVPVEGGGRIQVYYLRHADAEELAETLNSLLTGTQRSPTAGDAATRAAAAAGVAPQQLRAVSELAGAVTNVTADIGTNSLVIQASPEGFESLVRVIEKLDIARSQVLVEALIMEVGVNDVRQLGIAWALQFGGPDTAFTIQQAVGGPAALLGNPGRNEKGDTRSPALSPGDYAVNIAVVDGDNFIQAVLQATATDGNTNIISAPHILTSDNEEAEILVGDNIPIITNRVQSAAGIVTDPDEQSNLATSVNVERQDIGVTLRVTPQITEGDSLRMQIFQEITDINPTLQSGVGDVNQVGPALSNRRIENVVVAKDGSTVVVGGLVRDTFSDTSTKIPWLGDVPVLGWLFKNQNTELRKTNLLVFLTPHIIRSADDLEKASIGKRDEFRRRSEQALGRTPVDREQVQVESSVGVLSDMRTIEDEGPASSAVAALERRYPLERMRDIEREQAQTREAARQAELYRGPAAQYIVHAGSYADAGEARATLTELVDAGFDGTLTSTGAAGRVRYELRVGPYKDMEQAERAASTLQRAYELSSQIVVEREASPP